MAVGAGAATVPSITTGQADGDGTTPQLVSSFDPPNLPENIAVAPDGTLYLSMAVPGEIWAVTDEGEARSVATFDLADDAGLVLGITATDDGDLYAAVGSGNPETHGVWRVPPGGSPELVASLPAAESMPNGITDDVLPDGSLLVADHLGGRIWRVHDGEATVWLDDPLLDPNPYASSQIGVDGVALGPEGDLWVDNLNYGAVLRVPLDCATPGDPEVFVQNEEALQGCDGMTLDQDGNVYLAVNAQNEIVRVTPQKEIRTLASGGDLDFPADVHFGRTSETRSTLYFCNFAYPNFLSESAQANPSLMKLDLDAVGIADAG